MSFNSLSSYSMKLPVVCKNDVTGANVAKHGGVSSSLISRKKNKEDEGEGRRQIYVVLRR